MKITAVITDADIRYHIDQAATELATRSGSRTAMPGRSSSRTVSVPKSTSTNCTNAIPSAIARITGLRFSTWLTCTNTRSAIDTCVFP